MTYKYFKFLSNSSEIYLGKHPGKKIEESIMEAKHSIKIVSPYISATMLNPLVYKSQNGVRVTIVTSDSYSKYGIMEQRAIVEKGIQQVQNINQEKKHEKTQKIQLMRIIQLVSIILGIAGTVLIYHFLPDGVDLAWPLLYTLFCVIVFIVAERQLTVYKVIPIYSYYYNIFLDLKFLKYTEDFIHVKLIVIDDEVAFLGSTNFTTNGLNNNIESCVTFRDNDAKEISKYIDILLCENQFYSFEEIKKRYFAEPLY